MSGFEMDTTLNNELDDILNECCEETQKNSKNDSIRVEESVEESIEGSVEDTNSFNVEEYIDDNNNECDDSGDENVIELTFSDLILAINDKYFDYLNKIYVIFKDHKSLSKSIKYDIDHINEKLELNPNAILLTITDNYLYCLEQIKDKNADFFKYQKESIIKKKGNTKGGVNIIKNKITKIGSKTSLKDILLNVKTETSIELFNEILEIFKLLTYEEDNIFNFHEEYLDFIKEKCNKNKNYNKMVTLIDNIDSIMGSIDDDEIAEQEYKEKFESQNKKNNDSKKDKDKKGKGKGNGNIGEEFIKGIEDTKIAQMAKNISEKINLDDFPILTDPSKLLALLSNPEEGLGSISGLMDVVMGEVKSSFKETDTNENDLIGEAQNIMGKLSGTNLEPVNLIKNMNLDLGKMSDIFSNKK